jgi:hypothetical protein
MDEYIKREAAIAYIREQSEECQKAFEEFGGESGIYADAYNDLAEDFHSIPAADVAPVVHGRWEYTPQTFNTLGQIRCPFCAWWSLDQSIDGIYKYCPNCGAKMDGGDNDAAD